MSSPTNIISKSNYYYYTYNINKKDTIRIIILQYWTWNITKGNSFVKEYEEYERVPFYIPFLKYILLDFILYPFHY